MATGKRDDPYRNYQFDVEVDGLTVAGFSEVSGLVVDGDSVEYREGSDKESSPRMLPGRRKFQNIVLKRGHTQRKDLWAWYRNIANGVPDRRNGAIILRDEARNPVLRWNFRNAWPNKIEVSAFNAAGNEVVLETCELCHEGVDIEA